MSIAGVHKIFPAIHAALPNGLHGQIVYDSTNFVHAAIRDVARTLVEALVIVNIVVFLFLGSLRSVVIPMVAIPLSLVGAFTVMLALGFSINLLTLLALVLAIGLVVDDAIIVVENVNRHLEQGKAPACRGDGGCARAWPSDHRDDRRVDRGLRADRVSGRFDRRAVYGVRVHARRHGDDIGGRRLDVVADDGLAPAEAAERNAWLAGKALQHSSIALSRRIRHFYLRRLHNSLDYLPVTSVFALLVLSSIYFLYAGAKSELAPQEDQGVVITTSTLAPDATLQQKVLYAKEVFEIMKEYPETDHVFQINSPSRVVAGMVLKPWDERSRTSNQLQPIVQQRLNEVAGARIAAFQLPPLPGSQGLPVQFVIKTTDPFNRLDEAAQKFLKAAIDSGMFIFLDTDLKIDNPEFGGGDRP